MYAIRCAPLYFPCGGGSLRRCRSWSVAWIASLNEIDKLDFERVIPGHGAPVVPREAVRLTREYLEDLMAAVQTAMKETHDPEKLKQTVKLPKYQDWFLIRRRIN